VRDTTVAQIAAKARECAQGKFSDQVSAVCCLCTIKHER